MDRHLKVGHVEKSLFELLQRRQLTQHAVVDL
jgi:hypothetical protein